MCVHPQTDRLPERAARGGGHPSDSTLIDTADYVDDPLVLATLDLERTVASWDAETRDEVIVTLGGLAIICGTRGAKEHVAAAELLTLVRRLVRLVGEETEAARGN